MNTKNIIPRGHIQTASGVLFNLKNPRPEDIVLYDIAHSLSLTCRFGGHTKVFYSVAQHSVVVSHLVPRRFALKGLMHDATEAYLGDMVKPLKRILGLYSRFEERLWVAVCTRFGLSQKMPKSVKHADLVALVSERDRLFNNNGLALEEEVEIKERVKINPVSSAAAEVMFLRRFFELYN